MLLSTWVIIANGEDSITHRPTLVFTVDASFVPIHVLLDQNIDEAAEFVPVKTCTGTWGGRGGDEVFRGSMFKLRGLSFGSCAFRGRV